MRIRKADIHETALLSALSFRSKSFWGYDESFLNDAIEDLTLDPIHIKRGLVYLCQENERVLGYYAFSDIDAPELIALFVEPDFIGKGLGWMLWQHAIQIAASQGWMKFKIIADPFAAEKFYAKVGCHQIGVIESPIRKDRFLPLLEYTIK